MARISYNQLPPEGAKLDRDVARVVNQAMQGFQNCVFDFIVPEGAIDVAGEAFRVFDLRISQQKFIGFMPLNVAAAGVGIFVSETGNGFFDLTSLVSASLGELEYRCLVIG